MKYILIILMTFFLFSCTKENKKITIQKPKKQIVKKVKENYKLDYKKLDTLINKEIEILDKKYASVPFYGIIDGKKFFITRSKKIKDTESIFNGAYKYGIVNDSLKEILIQKFDKIYNPNMVILNCFEIKQKDKIGLFNYETNKILKPQFDFILPSNKKPTNIAYGYKNNKWHQIINSDLSVKEVDFNPISVLNELSFDMTNIGENMVFDSYAVFYEDDANEGNGIIVLNSFLEYFKLSEEYFGNVITKDNAEFGLVSAELKIKKSKTINDRVKSFLVSFIETGADGRGYENEKSELIIYDSKSKQIKSIDFDDEYQGQYYCKETSYKVLNDSIIEFKLRNNEDDTLYREEPTYIYHKIDADNKIMKLKTNRHFSFTKFTLINEDYFRGCFVKNVTDEEFDKIKKSDDWHNLWVAEHLTINDLDIMRNEIYADYGYKFTSKKWQDYFSSKSWYKPKYDNVDDKLSEMEKENIKLILEIKSQMKGKEDKFINKKPRTYFVAG